MTSLFGRVRFVRILMVTGNRDGLCGYTLLKAPFGTGIRALRRSVNRAGNRVCFIDRYDIQKRGGKKIGTSVRFVS